jgi:type I restriction enzyme M protein
MRFSSETETVIKKILPYLERKGYDIISDLSFEEPTILDDEYKKRFIDISINCGKATPYFLIEAKRDGTNINAQHRKQAINYGRSRKCLFVAVTNGQYFELLNVATKEQLKFNNSAYNRIPSKKDLTKIVIPQLKKNPNTGAITIPSDKSIPFRPGIPLSKLNHLISKCHNTIRKIEKNEEHAFADFSKILFLKLLEEKWDSEGETPPYTYAFHELAATPKERADQVKTAVNSMIDKIKSKTKYGEVLDDPIKLKKDQAYLSIVKQISTVSWSDCNLDSKGAAFEYFVRATLKGKKLGQYFTPRPLVQLMLNLGKYKQILSNLVAGLPFKVLDPACGTGGFLVYGLNSLAKDVEEKIKNGEIHKTLADKVIESLKEKTFFGIDAHEGVASSAKMNMIIAGDGHNNIRCEDSLKINRLIPAYKDENDNRINDGKAHLILTNPPFGTSEGESLTSEDLDGYEIKSTKGQSLFIQKMISSIRDNSRIVTVIDEGVLNTATYSDLRVHILKNCKIESVISLPDETFKPNKINVKSSVITLIKRDQLDEDLEDEYPVMFIKLASLGYDGAGNDLRGFNINKLISDISNLKATNLDFDKIKKGENWEAYKVNSKSIVADRSKRLDYKYWDIAIIETLNTLKAEATTKTIKDINQIETKRGSSPEASEYVSESEGYALVVKAGSNISKTGLLINTGDFIEQNIFQSYVDKKMELKDGDILLASTGDGTLGKCCVYRNKGQDNKSKPAIADGHVTIIRVNKSQVYPEYLSDYIRKGFGATQVNRLFTGATGLIEITPGDVNEILIPDLPPIQEQRKRSKKLRSSEKVTDVSIQKALEKLKLTEERFYSLSI